MITEKHGWRSENSSKNIKKRHLVFSIEKMAEDFRLVGYCDECIQATKKRWEKYDGFEVRLNIDSSNGCIIDADTLIYVNIKWCQEAPCDSDGV